MTSSGEPVKFEITQPKSAKDKAIVKCDYDGKVKTYTLIPSNLK